FQNTNSVLCIGFDPVIENIPVQKDTLSTTLVSFFCEIVDLFQQYALTIKPNIAFYEQYGMEGLTALKKIISYAKSYQLPVILDAKRGDIGSTSKAYAKSAFEYFQADAITLAPYMGIDSVSPFFEYKNKGFFVLARTSNPGSKDFQLQKVGDQFLYQKVTEKISQWNKDFFANEEPAIGAVAGATHLEELDQILSFFNNNNTPPLLIPGVGKQGGSFSDVINRIKKQQYPLERIVINSSSQILYAHKKQPDLKWQEASEIEIKKLLLT
ncbi:MAG: orotidine-5'-phosphate decarboxylase, partial [Spirochaetes bacterium]|nr:orotidine-5'-phosphate decarboxylase [Spirochaetota bacterium]